MALRTARHLTSMFLVRDGRVLLLYRRGSRAIADSWVGIGGHFEPHELADPTAAALRELHEEVGVTVEQLADVALRYVAVRDTGTEIRTTYYFTAELAADAQIPAQCVEGDLAWFDLAADPIELDMPPTAKIAFAHWLATGRHDRELRLIAVGADGRHAGTLR
jgi:8-oxo-dGTP diphosphatase